MKYLSLNALGGVGDVKTQWHEWTGRAYHVRRRLTAVEQQAVGPAVDCRGTDEWQMRYDAIKDVVPATVLGMALEERR